MDNPPTAQSIRLASRNGTITSTAYNTNRVQCNLIVLPSKYARSFISLCERNPVSCPLIWAGRPGDHTTPLAEGADLSTDLPLYNIYADGALMTPKGVSNITSQWSSDHVGFLIGCSYSFEHALTREGYPPKHTLYNPPRTVPMFKTTVPLFPAGKFCKGVVVVSMRPYAMADVPQVQRITRKFPKQHGEPIACGWGGAVALGIYEKVKGGKVDFGDWVEIDDHNGEVPVFWACGVTPQVAVMQNKLGGAIMSHRPGSMFVTDVPADDESRLDEIQQLARLDY